uniref:hypothetical protein n=1 Tax=Vibrio vulnificus TaxID=672 RepID=UPI0019D44CB1
DTSAGNEHLMPRQQSHDWQGRTAPVLELQKVRQRIKTKMAREKGDGGQKEKKEREKEGGGL